MKQFMARMAGYSSAFMAKFYGLQVCWLGMKKSILIVGESGSGQTAVALQVCKEYIEQQYFVIYFDCTDALFKERIEDFVGKDFIVVRPDGAEGILGILHSLWKEHQEEKFLFCFDAAYINSDDTESIRLKRNLEFLRKVTIQMYPNSGVIMTERTHNGRSSLNWSSTIKIEKSTLITRDREQLGHIALLSSDLGTKKVFVDYELGRLSEPYDFAVNKIDSEGANPTSYFEYDGESYRGLWNLVGNTKSYRTT